MIDWVQRPEYLQWVNRRLGTSFDSREAVTLTRVSQTGSILAIAVFSRFTKWNCEVTVAVAASRAVSKDFIRACLGYVFHQCNLFRVTAFIAVDNSESLNQAQRLGFRREGVAKAWFGERDAVLLGLLRDDATARWFKELHGQPLSAAGT